MRLRIITGRLPLSRSRACGGMLGIIGLGLLYGSTKPGDRAMPASHFMPCAVNARIPCCGCAREIEYETGENGKTIACSHCGTTLSREILSHRECLIEQSLQYWRKKPTKNFSESISVNHAGIYHLKNFGPFHSNRTWPVVVK
jgi:hypothetical protein